MAQGGDRPTRVLQLTSGCDLLARLGQFLIHAGQLLICRRERRLSRGFLSSDTLQRGRCAPEVAFEDTDLASQ
jgi:hypothetical protein